jgi:hypothetical protein
MVEFAERLMTYAIVISSVLRESRLDCVIRFESRREIVRPGTFSSVFRDLKAYFRMTKQDSNSQNCASSRVPTSNLCPVLSRLAQTPPSSRQCVSLAHPRDQHGRLYQPSTGAKAIPELAVTAVLKLADEGRDTTSRTTCTKSATVS